MINKRLIIILIITILLPIHLSNGDTMNRDQEQYNVISFTPELASITQGSEDIIIAIIDGGVDFSHQDLGEHLKWINPDEIANNGIDDDNNGFIDDVSGWDFVENDNDPSPYYEERDDNNNGRSDEYVSHGTFITGIIAGQGNVEITGIVPNIKILDIKIFNSDGTSHEMVNAWKYVASLGNTIKVINFSAKMSETNYNNLVTTINQIINSGTIIVTSSGNKDPLNNPDDVNLPGTHSDIISVGSVNFDKVISNFSIGGPNIDIVAPGEEIFSTVLDNFYTGNGEGTSYAAPFVTGAIAWVLSISNKNYSDSEIKDALIKSSQDLGPEGFDEQYGHGLVNMTNLVKELDIKVENNLNLETNFHLIFGMIIIIIIYRKIDNR